VRLMEHLVNEGLRLLSARLSMSDLTPDKLLA
jgi:hypothetical protein